ncbi:MAG TPA: ATP-binding cassette domain-containing protein [Chthoniobacterales bacterium]|jgi:ribose transport system ATP-binding protein|nr:ATP-binding cassette domain-containing protein [Chthoniobacterales bacterium]
MSDPSRHSFLRLEGVTKRYGGVTALANVDFECSLGTIHAVVGENGAGKTSLIKVIAGVIRPDEGRINLDDKPVHFASPADASRHGIACIFQELSLLPDLSVSDNISIANPPKRLALIDRRRQQQRAKEILHEIGCSDIHPAERVKDLPLSRQQMVEICKALVRQPRMIIMDEATSALTGRDVEQLYKVIRQLRDRGLAVLYISHRMHEIAALADICSVFRNGRRIDTFPMSSRTTAEIVPLMIGREVAQAYPLKIGSDGDSAVDNDSVDSVKGRVERRAQSPALEVKNLHWERVLNGISLTVGKGEIVGLGGLDGQGQAELLFALFGVLQRVGGEIRINGFRLSIHHPRRAKGSEVGMALIPEDRKTQGLLLPMSVRDNLVLSAASDLSNHGVIDPRRERTAIDKAVGRLQIKVHDFNAPVRTLSGGNQQKVVIGKWLMKSPRILLLNDPTRGIDVGTKQEIYRLLRELADSGIAILFYSTDYEELIGMCDRVLVCYGGKLVRELRGTDLNDHNLITASLNLGGDSVPADTSGLSDQSRGGDQSRWGGLRRLWQRNAGPFLAFVVFAIMFLLFSVNQQNGLSTNVLTSVSNKGAVLALVAMGQTLVILTGGFDLSAGMILTMASCLASVTVNGSPGQIAFGTFAVLASGLAAGSINAAIVVFGRIQPIIATLATGAIYFGIALLLRPTPGGEVSEDLSNALTYDLGGVPTTFLLVLSILLFVWWPFRNSVLGRSCYAIGSSENAAYMSGLAIGRSRFAAYALSGFLAAAGGLLLSLISLSGEASVSQGGFYTLNSIAAVAIGGTSLFGGSGGMIGSIFGALVLRTISDLLFAFNAPALWQPLFQGFILLGAVCLGAIRVLRRKNQMDVFQ